MMPFAETGPQANLWTVDKTVQFAVFHGLEFFGGIERVKFNR